MINNIDNVELQKVLEEVRRQMATTVLSYPNRDPMDRKWGNPKYNGNCSGKVPLGFVDKLNARTVSELYAGSGTLSDVCRDYDIPYCGIDLNPQPIRENIVSMNILDMNQELPTDFYFADMCFQHPPYPGINRIKYAGNAWQDRDGMAIYDIQNMPFYDGMQAINKATMRLYSAMHTGAYMVTLVGEIRNNGRYYSMLQNMVLPGEVYQTYVKLQHNTWSERQNYAGTHNTRALTGHEMVVVVRKPTGYEIAYVVPKQYVCDIRDSVETATWKDVVYSVLRHIGRECNMEEIYTELDGHKKTRANPHWKEKVRQVLQQLEGTGTIRHISRGHWQCITA